MALRRFPDTISRYLLATVVSAEESSSQVQVAFTAAQTARRQGATLGRGPARRAGIRGRPADDDRLPVLVAVSDNGPRMPGKATAAFLSASESPSTSGGHPRLNDQPGSSRSAPLPRPGDPRSPLRWPRSHLHRPGLRPTARYERNTRFTPVMGALHPFHRELVYFLGRTSPASPDYGRWAKPGCVRPSKGSKRPPPRRSAEKLFISTTIGRTPPQIRSPMPATPQASRLP